MINLEGLLISGLETIRAHSARMLLSSLSNENLVLLLNELTLSIKFFQNSSNKIHTDDGYDAYTDILNSPLLQVIISVINKRVGLNVQGKALAGHWFGLEHEEMAALDDAIKKFDPKSVNLELPEVFRRLNLTGCFLYLTKGNDTMECFKNFVSSKRRH